MISPTALIAFAIVTPAEAVAKVDAFTLVTNPLTPVQGAVAQPKVLSIVTDPGKDTADAPVVPMAPVAIAEPAERATKLITELVAVVNVKLPVVMLEPLVPAVVSYTTLAAGAPVLATNAIAPR